MLPAYHGLQPVLLRDFLQKLPEHSAWSRIHITIYPRIIRLAYYNEACMNLQHYLRRYVMPSAH